MLKHLNFNLTKHTGIFSLIFLLIMLLQSCKKEHSSFDASGTFEATEIIISAETTGKIIQFNVDEGDQIKKGDQIALVDTSNVSLQKDQIIASMKAIDLKQNSAGPQIMVYKQQLGAAEAQIQTLTEQMKVLKVEQKRIQELYKGEAATRQQLDEINGKVDILYKQLASAEQQKAIVSSQIKSAAEQVAIQNRSILSEKTPTEKRVILLNDQMTKSTVIAPINGTILTKYAESGEFMTIGKPMLKVADLSEMTLKAYITGDQLPTVKIGQPVQVFIDGTDGEYQKYPGKITYIADKAEFTPKTIQTKEERANLVYALKVMVKNDGNIKMGMYGEVSFENNVAAK